jgi:hypothetical protein
MTTEWVGIVRNEAYMKQYKLLSALSLDELEEFKNEQVMIENYEGAQLIQDFINNRHERMD